VRGIDGIKRKIDPMKAGFGPLDQNIYDLSEAEASKLKTVPGSLSETLDALKADQAFLTAAAFFAGLHRELPRLPRVRAEASRDPAPPYEFFLYYDC